MTKSVPVPYQLTNDVDIAGRIWPQGASVYLLELARKDEEKVDLFLTHRREYARRGSHAPVTRLSRERLTIEGEKITITPDD